MWRSTLVIQLDAVIGLWITGRDCAIQHLSVSQSTAWQSTPSSLFDMRTSWHSVRAYHPQVNTGHRERNSTCTSLFDGLLKFLVFRNTGNELSAWCDRQYNYVIVIITNATKIPLALQSENLFVGLLRLVKSWWILYFDPCWVDSGPETRYVSMYKLCILIQSKALKWLQCLWSLLALSKSFQCIFSAF